MGWDGMEEGKMAEEEKQARSSVSLLHGIPSLNQPTHPPTHHNLTPSLPHPLPHPHAQISDNKGNDLGQAALPIALGYPLDGPDVPLPSANPAAAHAATVASRGVFPPIKERVRVALSSGGVFKCVRHTYIHIYTHPEREGGGWGGRAGAVGSI
jgi:hypothetical protein